MERRKNWHASHDNLRRVCFVHEVISCNLDRIMTTFVGLNPAMGLKREIDGFLWMQVYY
jgi:hypothetical protein